jgi:hypothetical protein
MIGQRRPHRRLLIWRSARDRLTSISPGFGGRVYFPGKDGRIYEVSVQGA